MSKFLLNEYHLFESHDNYFVFLTNTLKLYHIDKDTYDYLSSKEHEFGFTQPFDCIQNDAEEFISAEIIRMLPESSANDGHIENASEKKEKIIPPLTNVVLQIANDCNLNCVYCYGDGGSYGRKRELMSLDTAKKAIDFLAQNSPGVDILYVTFFGGEPLINFDVVKGAHAYCKELEKTTDKKFLFSMTTNGTILNDEIYNFIKDNKISVMISMDGGKELQDKHRCYFDGRGSFDTVCNNITKFKQARGGYLTARATVCKTNINFKEIKDDLMGLGFTNVITSIVDTDENSDLFVGGDYSDEVLKQYQILADDYITNIKNGTRNHNTLFETILRDLYYKHLRIRSCNAGNNGLAVGSDGNLYPCHRFMGMEDYIVGNLDNGINQDISETYRHTNVFEKEVCKECWARFLCGGGCMHTSANHGNNVFKAPECYCDIYKGLYEIILYVYYSLKEWDDNIFRRMMEKAEDTVTTIK